MTATVTPARDLRIGVAYRATVESVQAGLRAAAMSEAVPRHDVDGNAYALVCKYDEDTIVAMIPPRRGGNEAWALTSNFGTEQRGYLAARWPDWRGWGLDTDHPVEIIDDRGEIEEFRARVHAAVSKEGRDRGWCSEADEWLTNLGLPRRGVVMNVSITGTVRVTDGTTTAQVQSRIARLLATERGLAVVVTQQPDVVPAF